MKSSLGNHRIVLLLGLCMSFVLPTRADAAELYVAVDGRDTNSATRVAPLRTIQRAADLAQPGDTITVRAGVYRERISPPRGGESDTKRIVYQAASGEKVEIRGSEIVKHWEKVQGDTWKVILPNTMFGDFNPYRDLLHGDWYTSLGRQNHTGSVYLNGIWLMESAALNQVLEPVKQEQLWYAMVDGASSQDYLLNVAWLQANHGTGKILADRVADRHGSQSATCSEGGQCIGFIKDGDWVRYDAVHFGDRSESVEIRAASASGGGDVELHLGKPDGELLGTCAVSDTGDWQKWASFTVQIKPTSGIQSLCTVFKPHSSRTGSTTIWAQFKGVDPNSQQVEINVRRTVFYPDKTGINYITVRGFTMCNAATPWAPPTAEQIGLIGTHWSKGWIIENNTISCSKCSGISLGKYGDEYDNRASTAKGYVGTIHRAVANGWNKGTIGSHVVRNNDISNCEQAGIVGSMGCSFSTITGNTIHDIHVHRLFSGAEMAGIKFHGAIDVVISHNHIHRTTRGIWLDWMAQGARVTGNLLHDNREDDMFFEVDHGPFVVDNNISLSPISMFINSQGGAFVHNLIAGGIRVIPTDARMTPFHVVHSTEIAGMHDNPSGDLRFYNNLVVESGDLSQLDKAILPVSMAGNVFLRGAKPSKYDSIPLLMSEFDPKIHFTQQHDGFYLEFAVDKSWAAQTACKLVSTEMLGKTKVSDLSYEEPDGSNLRINTDYFGTRRNESNPSPGPFELQSSADFKQKVW
jgi:alpha-L-arabinofuranosidase